MKTILVVEDNVDIRENTIEVLELAGFNVLVAENGKEGVEIAVRQTPDIILCDIMMPLMNGYDVLQHLKSNPSTAEIPFIYLTASAEKKEIQQALDMGADAYICKPFDINDLINEIDKVLSKRDR